MRSLDQVLCEDILKEDHLEDLHNLYEDDDLDSLIDEELDEEIDENADILDEDFELQIELPNRSIF